MTVKYQKVWRTMNDLEMIVAKVVSAREMIDIANECCSTNQQERAETMTMAAYEFLGYFIEEFDEKFKLAWQATVGDLRDGDKEQDGGFEVDTTLDDCMPPWGHSDLEYGIHHKETLTCNKDDPSPECKGAWTSFWEDNNQYTDEELDAMCDAAEKADKIVKWQLPVELDPSGEYFVTFPDDLLEAADLEEGDRVEWVDNGNGSYTLKKITKQLEMEEC